MASKSRTPQPPDRIPTRQPDRPRELQDRLNFYIFHPLARRLAVMLTHTPVTPNMVSVAGGLLVVGAGVAYAQPGWPLTVAIGFALHLLWHVVDGADGDLARLTGRSSPRGELVDGICDYTSHAVLYLILGSLLHEQIGPVAWVLAVGAGLSRILQANHYEVQRRQYQWWLYDVPWLRSTRMEGQGLGTLLGRAYLTLAQKMAPEALAADAAVAAAKSAPGGSEWARAAIRRHAKPMLESLSLLGANYRTIALGVSMFAGSPLYFFLYEAIALNLMLLRSVRTSKRSTRRLIAELSHAEASTPR